MASQDGAAPTMRERVVSDVATFIWTRPACITFYGALDFGFNLEEMRHLDPARMCNNNIVKILHLRFMQISTNFNFYHQLFGKHREGGEETCT